MDSDDDLVKAFFEIRLSKCRKRVTVTIETKDELMSEEILIASLDSLLESIIDGEASPFDDGATRKAKAVGDGVH